MIELIVLVNEDNEVIGQAEKLSAHNNETILHRAFSVFLFNKEGKLLIQQRSRKKKTWPLIWSNSCCGHPTILETPEQAARRRLEFELGITRIKLEMILPKYRYRYEHKGVVENEICPVLVGITTQEPKPNKNEVEAIKWIEWSDWLNEVSKPNQYSEWCVEETILLEKSVQFQDFLQTLPRVDYETTYLS